MVNHTNNHRHPSNELENRGGKSCLKDHRHTKTERETELTAAPAPARPGQHLGEHKMVHILVSPVRKMAGDASNQ